MNKLTVTGKQNFMGIEIPVVAGGFSKDKRCMSDKTIAEIHGGKAIHVRENINSNRIRFRTGVDIVDLKDIGTADNNLFYELGYTKMEIAKADHIYVLSERGYAKLIKIMDSDLAWKIHDKLIDEYFELREEKKESNKKPALSSVNMMVKNIMGTLEKAGVDDLFIAVEVKRLYTELGYEVKVPLVTDKEDMSKLYDCTEIAKELGIFSTGGNPHVLAVSAIIQKLHIEESEIVKTPFSRNGHDDVTVQYKPSVFEDVKLWLAENNYPEKIIYTNSKGKTSTCSVVYREVA